MNSPRNRVNSSSYIPSDGLRVADTLGTRRPNSSTQRANLLQYYLAKNSVVKFGLV
ncbi:hypothetical protein BOSEA1005_11559 [Hyphomicrobiales bacterium]|nr:hypothetical protein BOSEA1005_11559 [Hyphomicrobiales bacterium]CAI0342155.1 hypothetical protein BO1005MUT1_170111 [Hyphomicrobiales bacterium]